MRNVVLQMMTTLNGRLDNPDAWVTGISEAQYQEIDRVYSTFDTILVGQNTYHEMFAYWPGAETEPGGSETNKSMARKMNTYKKYVISGADEPQPLAWKNAEQVLIHSDEELTAFIAQLKAQPGGDIHVSGGAAFAQKMIRLGLIDEYHFFVYPVVSPGAAWFDLIKEQQALELVRSTTYENGVIGLYLRPLRASQNAPLDQAQMAA